MFWSIFKLFSIDSWSIFNWLLIDFWQILPIVWFVFYLLLKRSWKARPPKKQAPTFVKTSAVAGTQLAARWIRRALLACRVFELDFRTSVRKIPFRGGPRSRHTSPFWGLVGPEFSFGATFWLSWWPSFFHHFFDAFLDRFLLDFRPQLASQNPPKSLQNRCQDAFPCWPAFLIDFWSIFAPNL